MPSLHVGELGAASLATLEAWMGLRTDPDHLCFERSPIPGETTCLGGFGFNGTGAESGIICWDSCGRRMTALGVRRTGI